MGSSSVRSVQVRFDSHLYEVHFGQGKSGTLGIVAEIVVCLSCYHSCDSVHFSELGGHALYGITS